jgi:putative ABC transport system permease protein
MTQVVVRGFLGRKLRSFLTALAVILGVAMIVGSSVLTAQIKGAFDGIFLEARKGTDVVVTKTATFKNDQGQNTVPFAQSVVDKVKAVDGVQQAVGTVSSSTTVPVVIANGTPKPIKPTGGAPALGNSITPAPFNPTTVIEGRQPSAPNEISVEKKTADKGPIKVGQQIVLATPTGVHPVKVVGIYKFAGSTGGATQVIVTFPDGQTWFERVGQVDEVDVQAASGTSDAQLRDAVAKALPGFTVRTGVEQAKQESKDVAANFIDILGYILLGIGVVSTLAGAFIIFNTFWITVGQRIKELGLLRTLGASRRQLLVSVMAEALIVGVIASALGIVAGLGVAKGIAALFDAVGFGIPVGAMHLSTGTIILAMAVGVGVTLVASFVPALRSTRIPPVAAIREGAQLPPGWLARKGKILAPIVAILGLALVAVGLFVASGTGPVLLSIGAGALLLLFGVALTAPYVVPTLARVIGWPGVRFGGIPGRIARENAERNPSRTAVTAAALMIGIFLVSFVAVFAAGLKKSISDVLGTDLKASLFVSNSVGGGGNAPLEPQLAGQIAKVPGVTAVAPTSFASAKLLPQKTDVPLSSASPSFVEAYKLRWIDGSDDVIRNLSPTQVVIDDTTAKDNGLGVGSKITLENRAGKQSSYDVAGIVKNSQLVNGVLASPEGFAPLADTKGVAFMFVMTDPNANLDTVQAQVQKVATAANPIADVQSNQEVIDQISGQINSVVYLLYALLAVIVVISIVGIINTLLLSVFERTREIGLLRAVGTTRRQVRRMVRYESVITSVIGATLGVVVGVVFGGMMIYRIDEIPFAFPTLQIILFFIVAIIAGILAAILPARRASRLDILHALQYE